jgi:pyruvate dehydrogenase E1 component
VKGWALGPNVEGRNITHQAKKLTFDELKVFRDRLELPITDKQLEEDPPYYHPGMESAEVRYMLERRRALGGVVPKRVVRGKPLPVPATRRSPSSRKDRARPPRRRRWRSRGCCESVAR